MTGNYLVVTPRNNPHRCPRPLRFGGLPDGGEGTIWQCDCGQHWKVVGYLWKRISDRRARRIIRRHQRQETT